MLTPEGKINLTNRLSSFETQKNCSTYTIAILSVLYKLRHTLQITLILKFPFTIKKIQLGAIKSYCDIKPKYCQIKNKIELVFAFYLSTLEMCVCLYPSFGFFSLGNGREPEKHPQIKRKRERNVPQRKVHSEHTLSNSLHFPQQLFVNIAN